MTPCRYVHTRFSGGKVGTQCGRTEEDHCLGTYTESRAEHHDDDCFERKKLHHPFHRRGAQEKEKSRG